MTYNELSQAKARVGNDITQENLDDARALMNQWSEYRWQDTLITQTFSGNGSLWLELRNPIISITSLTIDEVLLVEGTDYDIRKAEGRVRVYSGISFGHDNVVVVYHYGFTETGPEKDFFIDTINSVKMVEASLALFLRRNPLLLSSIDLEGSNINFGDYGLEKILSKLPKPINFGVAGGFQFSEPDNADIL